MSCSDVIVAMSCVQGHWGYEVVRSWIWLCLNEPSTWIRFCVSDQ